jgi:hypothetical protein
MFGDRPVEDDVCYLEQNDLNLKLADKDVSIAFIRPLRTFDLTCKIEHRMANHNLNRTLVRSNVVDDVSGEWDYQSWALSMEGRQLLELEREWREDDTM